MSQACPYHSSSHSDMFPRPSSWWRRAAGDFRDLYLSLPLSIFLSPTLSLPPPLTSRLGARAAAWHYRRRRRCGGRGEVGGHPFLGRRRPPAPTPVLRCRRLRRRRRRRGRPAGGAPGLERLIVVGGRVPGPGSLGEPFPQFPASLLVSLPLSLSLALV